ncbi:hypothetical protein KC644_04060 [Candidatus Berkelbacteria bacterium]|nr:hypothetical protein [Candidatus Berkelbacteria bacterium]
MFIAIVLIVLALTYFSMYLGGASGWVSFAWTAFTALVIAVFQLAVRIPKKRFPDHPDPPRP